MSCGADLVSLVPHPTSESMCMCPSSGSYYGGGASCAQCSSPSYCPDQWNSFTCPGISAAAHMTTSQAKTTPAYCVCADGFYGPACRPCPDGFYCKYGTTMANQAQLFDVSTTGVLSSVDIATLTEEIRLSLLNFFSLPANSPLIYDSDTTSYMYIKIYNTTHTSNRYSYRAMVMVQLVRPATIGWQDIVTRNAYGGAATAVLNNVAFISEAITLAVTQPARCTTGQPNVAATACVCQAGTYQASAPGAALSCLPCQLGTFMQTPNPSSACTICPLNATTTAEGSTACTPVISTGSGSSLTPSLLLSIAAVLLMSLY